ncbi:MAG: ribonuclease T [Zoogloeaceae bacterium]|nr:ribonuclease T [Gammaproteobacteria bacterium]MCP5230870.1 ribonuclease T [Zoogloeaceae bacterium]
MNESTAPFPIGKRFRGFLPVVIDVETGGFNARTDALLEIAATILRMDEDGYLHPDATYSTHVIPFEGANLDPKSLEVNGIDPYHPLRAARNEKDALGYIFSPVRNAVKDNLCTRAVLVGHNANFDLSFLNAAVDRCGIKRNPFHPFSTFDTVTLGALAVGQTVLARACEAIGVKWDGHAAHSAVYDTERTAELFCEVLNRWRAMELTCGGKARKQIPPG